MSRPGNAVSNTAIEHVEAARLALVQLPKEYRRGRQTLITAVLSCYPAHPHRLPPHPPSASQWPFTGRKSPPTS
jgi:hypothetical protein